jgi:hypothetical protein
LNEVWDVKKTVFCLFLAAQLVTTAASSGEL